VGGARYPSISSAVTRSLIVGLKAEVRTQQNLLSDAARGQFWFGLQSGGNISFRLRRSRDNPSAKPLPMNKSAAGTRFVAASLSILPRLSVIAYGDWRAMVQRSVQKSGYAAPGCLHPSPVIRIIRSAANPVRGKNSPPRPTEDGKDSLNSSR
jgi:hypothetical protein